MVEDMDDGVLSGCRGSCSHTVADDVVVALVFLVLVVPLVLLLLPVLVVFGVWVIVIACCANVL